MTVLPLLAVGFFMKIVAALFILCSLVLILVVLIQKGKGGGLSSAFGGAMAGGLLGSKTGDFLTWVTIGVVSLFLVLAVIMAKFYKPYVTDVGAEQATQQKQSQDKSTPSGETPTDVNAKK